MQSSFSHFRNFLLPYLVLAVLQTTLPVHSQGITNGYGGQPPDTTSTDIEYGVIRYSSTPRSDPIAILQARTAPGLKFDPARGYLDSLLEALAINPVSQILVFSRTSINVTNITPQTPRAIYFNDDTYVAWIPGSEAIEIASMDPILGQVFYTLNQDRQAGGKFEQQASQCLRCHDSYSLTGGGVPRFILGSGYIGANGNLVSHEGWILTDPETPLKFRWGGWYVTGKHGDQVHLGNIVVNDPSELQQLDSLRKGNIDKLDALINTRPYLTGYSDIVALMVIEHQVYIQNLITRVNYDLRTALHDYPEFLNASVQGNTDIPESVSRQVRDISEPLIMAMLMVNETALTDPIAGGAGFTEWFENQGPHDSQQRSLRDLDLKTRLFRYPLSYLIYSDAFNKLPLPARQQIYQRLAAILSGEDNTEKFRHLSADDRTAILSILHETKPDFTAVANKQ